VDLISLPNKGGIVRKFSIRPTLQLKGRKFKGLRGWSGKPLHPPLTDFPIVAFVLAAAFDVISAIGGKDHAWARDLSHAGTFTFLGGGAVSVLTILTGLWDAWKSSEAGTQVRRTINAHATIMSTVAVLALVDIAWRLDDYHTKAVTPATIAVLSVIIALLVSLGATFGGTLVYDYGFNVETAADSPVWHKSEEDVFPGHHSETPQTSADVSIERSASRGSVPNPEERRQLTDIHMGAAHGAGGASSVATAPVSGLATPP
jgi:uncharacterized membrane protein